jgi:F1F0 ATPase subunit 2
MTAGMAGDLILGLLAGLALGALHMLWLRRASARLGARAGTGALLAGASLRMAVVLAGFAAVASVAMQPGLALIAALGGFALARTLWMWRIRSNVR